MTESTDATVVAEPIAERMSRRDRIARAMGGDAWTIGLAVAFVALYVFTLLLKPAYGLRPWPLPRCRWRSPRLVRRSW